MFVKMLAKRIHHASELSSEGRLRRQRRRPCYLTNSGREAIDWISEIGACPVNFEKALKLDCDFTITVLRLLL